MLPTEVSSSTAGAEVPGPSLAAQTGRFPTAVPVDAISEVEWTSSDLEVHSKLLWCFWWAAACSDAAGGRCATAGVLHWAPALLGESHRDTRSDFGGAVLKLCSPSSLYERGVGEEPAADEGSELGC